jgi:hypothetical protein
VWSGERGLNNASGRTARPKERGKYKIQSPTTIIWETTKRAANAMHNAFSSLEWRERNVQLTHHNNSAGRTVNPSIFRLNGTLMMKRHLICLQSGRANSPRAFFQPKNGENARALMHKRRGSLSHLVIIKYYFVVASCVRACITMGIPESMKSI